MRQTELEKYFTIPRGETSANAVKCMRTKVIRAGDALDVECYPLIKVNRSMRRAMRKADTRAGQHRANKRRRTNRVRRLIEANFTEADFVITGTYDYGMTIPGFFNQAHELDRYTKCGLPWDIDDALRDVQNYIRRVKYQQRKRDRRENVKYIYVLEATKPTRPGFPDKYHFHMVLHAPGLTADELKSIWKNIDGHGFTSCTRLSLRNNGRYGNAASMARYLTKCHDSRLNTSKNLKQPTVEVFDNVLSPSKASSIAREALSERERLFETIYPGYKCTRAPEIYFSNILPGACIYVEMRRIVATVPRRQRSA